VVDCMYLCLKSRSHAVTRSFLIFFFEFNKQYFFLIAHECKKLKTSKKKSKTLSALRLKCQKMNFDDPKMKSHET